MLPTLNLSLSQAASDGDKEVEESNTLFSIGPFHFHIAPPAPAIPPTVARQILSRGAISIAVLNAADTTYKLVVDIEGVPRIATFAALKSLVMDSWIVTSSALAPIAQTTDTANAIVRGLIMLLIKRVLGIKQMGIPRDMLALLSFVKLASVASRYTCPAFAETLSQISAIPLMIYTALARLVVDNNKTLWESIAKELRSIISQKQTPRIQDAKHNMGKHCKKLIDNWNKEMNENSDLAEYIKNTGRDDRCVVDFKTNVLDKWPN